jgi:putative MATE family efflux protein
MEHAMTAASRSEQVRSAMLYGPILPVMLRLTLPNLASFIVQIAMLFAEVYFVSFLGTAALAGITVVTPLFTLMTMLSNGGIGAGVTSAMARSLGSGRKDDADAILFHSLVLAVVFGAAFSLALLYGGPALYRLLGASNEALQQALRYSNMLFIGATAAWTTNLLSAGLRGTGNMFVPSMITLTGAAVVILLSPLLIFGWGIFPRLGIAGAATALLVYYVGTSVVLLWYIISGRSRVRLSAGRLQRRICADILRVGGISSAGIVQANLTVVLVTSAVGHFGASALAGYGVGARLEYFMLPILFALGVTVATMIGANVGAGRIARARRIALSGALLGAVFAEAVGLAAAAFPASVVGLFSNDPAALAAGSLYLRIVGPVYGLIGFGQMLYLAGQGAGRVLWPFVSGSARLLIAGILGLAAVSLAGADLRTLCWMVAAGATVFGVGNGLVMLTAWWSRPDMQLQSAGGAHPAAAAAR